MQSKSPLEFEVIATDGRARASRLKLHRHDCLTPMFMPVGTQGSVKGLTSSQLEELECQVILGNTYHLENKPGSSLLRDMGGLPAFMNWGRGTLTDSGGFQMVSLLDLADISVSSERLFTPTTCPTFGEVTSPFSNRRQVPPSSRVHTIECNS